MKAVVATFSQEKALVGAFSVITNLRMELFQALHGTRGSAAQRGAAPAWRPPGPAAAFMVKIKDVFKRSDCILIIRFKQLTFRQLSISSNRRDHDGIGVLE